MRPDAIPLPEKDLKSFLAATTPRGRGWSEEEWVEEKGSFARLEEYMFKEGDLDIVAFWFWDGDGTLYFRVVEGNRILRQIVNHDCKKDYEWKEI